MRKDLSSIVAVIMGTAGAQIVTLVFTPLLTRIFTPQAFGHLGVFMALASILIPIAALTLPLAIVLTKERREAKQIAHLSVVIALITAPIIFIFVYSNFNWLLNVLKAGGEGGYLYWVPLVVFFSALFQINENLIIKLGYFKLRAKVSVLHALVINTLKLLLGLVYPTAALLILIAVINPLVNALMLFIPLRKELFSTASEKSNLKQVWKKKLFKYRDFPLFQTPQALINALSQSGPVILLAIFFGPAAAGFYTFSRMLLALPIILVGKAVGDVFYTRASDCINKEKYQEANLLLVQSTLLLSVVGVIPLAVVLLWGPELFALAFGQSWAKAGVYAQWLSLWTFFILINSPSLKMIIVLQKQKLSLIVNIISTPIRIGVLFVGGWYLQDERLTVMMFVGISILHNIMIILLAYHTCNKRILNIESH